MAFVEVSSEEISSVTSLGPAGTTTVVLAGSAEGSASEALHQFLERLHRVALEVETKEVTFDVTKLEFIASAGLKQLLTWFSAIEDQPEEKQYRVRLVGSRARSWQTRSLPALACFSVRLLSVEWREPKT